MKGESHPSHPLNASLCLSVSTGLMQMMETEFSKKLKPMVALHLHNQKSIPAFLSAVTLDLFSQQTVS
ncbi:hypothetical protein NHX12_018764 [Muraenolepis orangiensis]|uniref:Uncharacterized protein n=1 Tax=Muraenolepis orangiensis TaxID=630683 RepID=A0A9Q0F003_9TELE|nr:hypothetical protein NHX12_018764 [Muraenolepis orangiensis]